MRKLDKLIVEYRGVNFMVLGITYRAERESEYGSLIPDEATWDIICLAADTGKSDLTSFLAFQHLDNIVDKCCEHFRENPDA